MDGKHFAPTAAPATESSKRARGEMLSSDASPSAATLPVTALWRRANRGINLTSSHLGRAVIGQLQSQQGNAFVGRLLGDPETRSLQRHPSGTPMTHDPVEAESEIQDPPPLPTAGRPLQPAEDGAPTFETPPEAESDPTTGAPAVDEVEPATGEKDKTPPAPATSKVMNLAKAEEVLNKSYGTTKKMVPGKIVILADREAIWKQYDENNKGRQNPYNENKPWADGDAKKYIPGLDGFATKSLGTVYVNEQTTLATATAHEMLHNNTEAGFRAAVGETINEGATEYLALKALKDSSVPLMSGRAYPNEVAFVTKLAKLVTEPILIDAYFNGALKLIDKFDEMQGKGEFAKMKPLAEAQNFTEANKLLVHDLSKI